MAYGITISISILVSVLIAEKLSKKSPSKLKPETLWNLALISIIAGVLGARLYHVASMHEYYLANPMQILMIWKGGLGIWGAVIFGVGAALAYSAINKEPILPWLDIAGVVLPLGQAIGRLGNFFNHELFGKTTSLPWGIEIPELAGKYHPIFAYESLLNTALFFILYKSYPPKKAGNTFARYIAGYSIIRFFLEFLRTDSWTIYGLNVAQTISILLIVGSLIFMRGTKNDIHSI